MLKIRLRRMGAIRQPHYRVVVADARAPRDGAFIENLGHYNPLTDPATIQIDIAKYEDWKRKGAQPTDAVASLVKQFNRTQRKAAAAGEAAGDGGAVAPAKPDARTRVASGKRAEPKAEAATTAAPSEETSAVEDAPMNEAMAEATRDGGEGSEAMTDGGSGSGGGSGDGAGGQESDAAIGEAAETGGSANPGAAIDES